MSREQEGGGGGRGEGAGNGAKRVPSPDYEKAWIPCYETHIWHTSRIQSPVSILPPHPHHKTLTYNSGGEKRDHGSGAKGTTAVASSFIYVISFSEVVNIS